MFPQENEYKSLLPKNAHGSPNFDKAACTNIHDCQVLVYQERLDFCHDKPAVVVVDRCHDFGWEGSVGFVGFQGHHCRFDFSGQVQDLAFVCRPLDQYIFLFVWH